MSEHYALIGTLMGCAAMGLASTLVMKRSKQHLNRNIAWLGERLEADNAHTRLMAEHIQRGASRDEIIAMERSYWSRDEHTVPPL